MFEALLTLLTENPIKAADYIEYLCHTNLQCEKKSMSCTCTKCNTRRELAIVIAKDPLNCELNTHTFNDAFETYGE